MNRFAIIYESENLGIRVRTSGGGYNLWEHMGRLSQSDINSNIALYGKEDTALMEQMGRLRPGSIGTFRLVNEDELSILLILCA